jgi:hypothetical protein
MTTLRNIEPLKRIHALATLPGSLSLLPGSYKTEVRCLSSAVPLHDKQEKPQSAGAGNTASNSHIRFQPLAKKPIKYPQMLLAANWNMRKPSSLFSPAAEASTHTPALLERHPSQVPTPVPTAAFFIAFFPALSLHYASTVCHFQPYQQYCACTAVGCDCCPMTDHLTTNQGLADRLRQYWQQLLLLQLP